MLRVCPCPWQACSRLTGALLPSSCILKMAIRLSCSSGAVPVLTAVHHSSLCQQHICKLLETTAGPVLDALQARCWEAEVQAQQLRTALKEHESSEAERKAAGALTVLYEQHFWGCSVS